MRSAVATLRRPPDEPLVSLFEFWPGWLFYAPIVVQWIALGLRYGDLSLPTAANPRIDVGGLCGESKSAILDQVGASERALLAPYTSLIAGTIEEAERAMTQADLAYPLVVKPDIGCNGTGVRLVDDRSGLSRFVAAFPKGRRLLLQQFVPWEGEAGIFYVRRPGERCGHITSLTLKHAPSVIGNGRASLGELIMADPRASLIPQMYLPRLAGRLDEVPRPGQRVRLVFVGNHCKGSIFRDGRQDITPPLRECIDALARALPEFHFGRIDVRYRSIAALRRGEDFRVIEINGVGSEATHVWDARTGLMDAWAAQFHHYRAAFEIGRANRARGLRPSGIRLMWRHWQLQRRLMATYPVND